DGAVIADPRDVAAAVGQGVEVHRRAAGHGPEGIDPDPRCHARHVQRRSLSSTRPAGVVSEMPPPATVPSVPVYASTSTAPSRKMPATGMVLAPAGWSSATTTRSVIPPASSVRPKT